MPAEDKSDELENYGDYIVLDGEPRKLTPHLTEFSVETSSPEFKDSVSGLSDKNVRQFAIGMSRVAASQPEETEKLMSKVREKEVAHHIYQLADTGEEIIITDLIFLTLKEANPADVNAIVEQYRLILEIAEQYKLIPVKHRDNVYTLKVTTDSGRNPLKIANEIAHTRSGVLSCIPETLFSMRFGALCANQAIDVPAAAGQHEFFKSQWHLTTDEVEGAPFDLLASINVPKAWEIAESFGKPDIVIAVIDDGFDLPRAAQPAGRHQAFAGSIIDTDNMRDFGGGETTDQFEGDPTKNPVSRGEDFHGTCVASIISASGSTMLGVAPCCKLLPVRIAAFSHIRPSDLLNAIKEVAKVADVINCSFSMSPQSFSLVNRDPEFVPGIKELIKNGGRRPGKGLVIVFAAGNDNAPIFLPKEANKHGISYLGNEGVNKKVMPILPGLAVHCGYSEIEGVVVVGAMTSLKRKAAYSNWGEEITIVAPSDNGHGITEFQLHLDRSDPAFQQRFPGLGIVAAINRTNHGRRLDFMKPIPPNAANTTPGFNHTKNFGGTSAAAAIVSGVIGLMLSVNPNLSVQEIIDILKDTADDKMNAEKLVDLDNDLNLRDVKGEFVKKRSLFFGSGKVDAAAAVQWAKDLL